MKIALVLALVSFAAPAWAQTDSTGVEQARALFQEGMDAVGREDYATALEAFTRSWELNPKPIALFNVAMCRRALADLPAAYDAFHAYLDVALEEPTERRAQAERMLEELDAALARVAVTASVTGAQILVDGAAVGTSPLGAPVRVTTGTHVFQARADGFEPAEEIVEVAAGEAVDVAFTLRATVVEPPVAPGTGPDQGPPLGPPVAPVAPVAEEEGGIASQWWFWTILGVVVVGAGVTAGVLLWPEDDTIDMTVMFR